MVLYYNQPLVNITENTNQSLLSNDIIKSSNKLYTLNTPEFNLYQENKGLLEILNTSFFGNTQEMHSRLLEENFINLSTDEKLNYLFKNNIIQDRITKGYMFIIIILLLVIIYKLYF